jgi:gliding motility-associated-like protein
MICSASPAQITNPIPITIFDAGTNAQVQTTNATISSEFNLSKVHDEECIANDKPGCFYHIVIYDLPIIELPSNSAGYIFSYQRCCRIIDIVNMPNGSNAYGNTFSITIPGSNAPMRADTNSSPKFLINDTALVCNDSYFEVPFIATDPNGDSLSYYFCAAWNGGTSTNSTPNPATAPPYASIPYSLGFSGVSPLGSGVTINSQTGIISGIAPSKAGEYVVTVCVNEYKQGVLIGSSRKELHLTVGDCAPIQATLDPDYITCDGFTMTFFNQTNSGVNSFFWDFGVTSQTNDTSNIDRPTFTFPDTGVYTLKLVVNRGQTCGDSTTAKVKVYPGFFPGFSFAGICVNKPTNFFDTTLSIYGGTVDGWNWNFGDLNSTTDISTLKNPTYTYTQTGSKTVQLIVSSSKGCIDTIAQNITIIDKPPLTVFPQDTLICIGDNVQLNAVGVGLFSWTPATNISNTNTSNPVVNPTTTTDYIVQLDDNGCINRDTARVRVVNFVTLAARPDTVICEGDSVRLFANTDGLKFNWTPTATIVNPNALITFAVPTTNPTTYQISSTIGGCTSTDDFTVTLAPYPGANAGPDAIICYDASAQLNGSMVGTAFTWTPTVTLNDPGVLNPLASPKTTTDYILRVIGNTGCPKPKFDTVTVTVLPKIIPFAGRDTAVVVGQPLQFNATGGTTYSWSPSFGLSRVDINNPIGMYTANPDSIRYKVVVGNINGCFDSAYVTVKIFNTKPQIFVPTAFTPNRDGKNDTFKPLAVGITKFDYFQVYNRWGQLVFSTTINEYGWDGKIGGKDQPSGTFVWMVKGTDFTGKVVFAKGTVTLIR